MSGCVRERCSCESMYVRLTASHLRNTNDPFAFLHSFCLRIIHKRLTTLNLQFRTRFLFNSFALPPPFIKCKYRIGRCRRCATLQRHRSVGRLTLAQALGQVKFARARCTSARVRACCSSNTCARALSHKIQHHSAWHTDPIQRTLYISYNTQHSRPHVPHVPLLRFEWTRWFLSRGGNNTLVTMNTHRAGEIPVNIPLLFFG